MLAPWHDGHAGVQRRLVGTLEGVQRPQHTTGQTRPKYCALRIAQRALDIDPGYGGRRLRYTKRKQFIDKQVFQTLGAGDEKFHGNADHSGQKKGATGVAPPCA